MNEVNHASSGKKGQCVFTDGKDEEHLSHGVYDAYTKRNLRYSQCAPLDMFAEKNTKNNLPAQVGFRLEEKIASTYRNVKIYRSLN